MFHYYNNRVLSVLKVFTFNNIVKIIFLSIIQLSSHHRRIQVSIKARLSRAEPARQLQPQQTVINSMATV